MSYSVDILGAGQWEDRNQNGFLQRTEDKLAPEKNKEMLWMPEDLCFPSPLFNSNSNTGRLTGNAQSLFGKRSEKNLLLEPEFTWVNRDAPTKDAPGNVKLPKHHQRFVPYPLFPSTYTFSPIRQDTNASFTKHSFQRQEWTKSNKNPDRLLRNGKEEDEQWLLQACCAETGPCLPCHPKLNPSRNITTEHPSPHVILEHMFWPSHPLLKKKKFLSIKYIFICVYKYINIPASLLGQ